MLLFITIVVLLLAAFTAGWVCNAAGKPIYGVVTALALAISYLMLWIAVYWIAGILILAGAFVVLKCQVLRRSTTERAA